MPFPSRGPSCPSIFSDWNQTHPSRPGSKTCRLLKAPGPGLPQPKEASPPLNSNWTFVQGFGGQSSRRVLLTSLGQACIVLATAHGQSSPEAAGPPGRVQELCSRLQSRAVGFRVRALQIQSPAAPEPPQLAPVLSTFSSRSLQVRQQGHTALRVRRPPGSLPSRNSLGQWGWGGAPGGVYCPPTPLAG